MVREAGSSASGEASIAMEQERAWDRVMTWIGLYLPTVGTSVTLHAAMVLLALVLVPFAPEPPPAFEPVDGGIMKPEPEYEAEERPTPRSPRTQDPLEERPSTSIKYADLEKPGFGKNPLADLDGLVGLGSSRLGGDWPGVSEPPGPPNLFRRKPRDGRTQESRVVYLVDRSGSMSDSLDFVKYALKARIAELPEACLFHVIFFSSGPPVEMPTRRLVPATERNRRRALAFIDRVVAQGETDPSEGFDRAFAADPRVVYFLTDGEFDKAVIDQVDRLNAGGEVTVHTIGFLYRPNEEALRTIAERNGGEYTFVSEAALSRLGA